jgi:putative oxygen-independent coproporphyrinogen III oxidase
VFFGGGTPSLLPDQLLLGILGAISDNGGLAPGAEVTVECNPETVTAAKLAAYKAGGVTRLSFGVQSMVPHVLASLGREHDPDAVHGAAAGGRAAGFEGAFSTDLIFGAAGESVEDWEFSLRGAVALGPAHISAYALTVEPGTPLAADHARHPVDDDQAAKYALADEVLSEAGYAWYEISNWAKPGAQCRHNLLYWSRGEYLGIGCAAHSHLRLPQGKARRWWNVRTPERYCRLVEAGQPAEAADEVLGPSDTSWEELMLSLRTSSGVGAACLPDEVYDAGLATRVGPSGDDAGRGVLTVRGRLLANEVAVRLRTQTSRVTTG